MMHGDSKCSLFLHTPEQGQNVLLVDLQILLL